MISSGILYRAVNRNIIRPFHGYCSSNPTLHVHSDVGKYYTIDKKDFSQLDPLSHIFKETDDRLLFGAIGEASLMVRKPMLTVFDIIEKHHAYVDKSNLRVVLYGHEPGVGKTFVLFNALHRAFYNKWWIIHFPSVKRFVTEAKEVVLNDRMPGKYDTPIEAARWLEHFSSQNEEKLMEDKYRTSVDYVWNERESTQKGSFLRDLIAFGMQRAKYASDCVLALFNEVARICAEDRETRMFIALDGINALFSKDNVTWIRNSSYQKLLTTDLSMVSHIKGLLSSSLPNTITLCTIGPHDAVLPRKLGRVERRRELRHFLRPTRLDHVYEYDGPNEPMALLGLEGFASLSPFVPVEVGKLTEFEFNNLLDYYKEKKWITHPLGHTEDAKNQIRFLTALNAREIFQMLRAI